MKEQKKINWLLVGLVVLCVAIVVLSVGIAIKLVRRNIGDEEFVPDIQRLEVAYKVDDSVREILDRFETDINYTMGDVEKDFVRLIGGLDSEEKAYAITPYAYFVFEQTGDIQKAGRIMEDAANSIDDDLKAGYYTSIGILYEEAEMYDLSAKYYNMASELYAESDTL